MEFKKEYLREFSAREKIVPADDSLRLVEDEASEV